MAAKTSDLEAVLGCYVCHLKLDGPESDLPEPYDVVFKRAKERTHNYWKYKGYL